MNLQSSEQVISTKLPRQNYAEDKNQLTFRKQKRLLQIEA